MFTYWFTVLDAGTGQTFAHPLTMDPNSITASGIALQYTFQAQDLLSILSTILLMLPPNFYFRCNPDNTVLLTTMNATADHIWQVGRHITNPQYSQDRTQLRNDIYLSGNGNIFGRATGASVSTIGQRLYTQSDNRVTDNHTAQILARGLLNLYDQTLIRTKVRIPDYRGDNQAGLGYDIESVHVGDMVEITDTTGGGAAPGTLWDVAHWDRDVWDITLGAALNRLVPIVEITYNWDSLDVALGSLPPSRDAAIFAIQRAFADFSVV
jgi:hypothetical protein